MTKLTGSNIDLLGTYGVCFDGFGIDPSGSMPLVAVGWMHADGQGHLTVKRTSYTNNIPLEGFTEVISGTYKMDPNGTGTATLAIPNPGGGDPTQELYSFVINSDNNEVQFIGTGRRNADGIAITTSTVIIRGVGRKQ